MTESPHDHCTPDVRKIAAALGHLARHLGTGCPRAGELATLLFDCIIEDPGTDPELRKHAHQLIDALERNPLGLFLTHTTPAHPAPVRSLPAEPSTGAIAKRQAQGVAA